MMHQSIATIDSPEFINLQPLEINPLMSSCEIKVLYLGENRNRSYITKDVATEMAKTLRGAPIVGYYKEEKEDFADHGERVIFDDEGVKFECLTKPYGFVAPDAQVWFQKFEDIDEFGNPVIRDYLMTTGFLWTGQFEECKLAVEEGRPQSMELDPDTLDGHWSTNNKTGMDFFIINDAIFSKLCILGEDVEPCFEGANVTAPTTSFTKTIDDNFKKTLYNMMQDLKFALEGGQNMAIEENTNTVEETVEESTIIETTVEEEAVEENFSVENDNSEQSDLVETQDSMEVQNNEEVEIKEDVSEELEPEIEYTENENTTEEKEDTTSTTELLEELNRVKAEYAKLETDYQELVAFKETIENKEKDNLIDSFYMLTDEDKADVITNKSNYSLDEIEAKLSVICVRKKVSFDLDDKEEENQENITTYTCEETSSVPAWIRAVKNTRDCKND